MSDLALPSPLQLPPGVASSSLEHLRSQRGLLEEVDEEAHAPLSVEDSSGPEFTYLNCHMTKGIILTIIGIALTILVVTTCFAWSGFSLPGLSRMISAAKSLGDWSNACLLASVIVVGYAALKIVGAGVTQIKKGCQKPVELIPIEIFAKEILRTYNKKNMRTEAIDSCFLALFVPLIMEEGSRIEALGTQVAALLYNMKFPGGTKECRLYLESKGFETEIALVFANVIMRINEEEDQDEKLDCSWAIEECCKLLETIKSDQPAADIITGDDQVILTSAEVTCIREIYHGIRSNPSKDPKKLFDDIRNRMLQNESLKNKYLGIPEEE